MGNQESTSARQSTTAIEQPTSSGTTSTVSSPSEASSRVPSRLSPLLRKDGVSKVNLMKLRTNRKRNRRRTLTMHNNDDHKSPMDVKISACGQNSRGQFGVAIDEIRNQRTSASFSLCTCEWSLYMKDISQIACGRDFVVMLCQNGDCFSSGSNDVGQLGLGGRQVTAMRNFDSPMEVQVLSHQMRDGATDVSAYSDRRYASLSSFTSGVTASSSTSIKYRSSYDHWKSKKSSGFPDYKNGSLSSSALDRNGGSGSRKRYHPSVHSVSTNPSGKCVMYLSDLNQDLIVKHCVGYWVRLINEQYSIAMHCRDGCADDTSSILDGQLLVDMEEESQSFYEFMQGDSLTSEPKSTPHHLTSYSSSSRLNSQSKPKKDRGMSITQGKRRRVWRIKDASNQDINAESSMDHFLRKFMGDRDDDDDDNDKQSDSSGEMFRKFYCYSSGSHSSSSEKDEGFDFSVSDSKEITDDRMSGLSSVHSDCNSEVERGYAQPRMRKPKSGSSISESSWKEFYLGDAVKNLAKTAILQNMDYGGGMDSLKEAFGSSILKKRRINSVPKLKELSNGHLECNEDSVISGDTSVNVDREYNVCAVGTGLHGYGLTPSLSGMVGDPSQTFHRLDPDADSEEESMNSSSHSHSDDDDESDSSFVPPLYVPTDIVSMIAKYVRLGVVSVSGCLFDSSRLNSFFPTPIRRPFLTQRISIVSTAVGFNHALFLTERGHVYSYGMNTVGQTGLSSPRVISQATRVRFPKLPVDFDETFYKRRSRRLYSVSITDDGSDLSADSGGTSLDCKYSSQSQHYWSDDSDSDDSSSNMARRADYVDYYDDESSEDSSSDGGFLFMRKWRKKKMKNGKRQSLKSRRRRKIKNRSPDFGRMSSYSRTRTNNRSSSTTMSHSDLDQSSTMNGWDDSHISSAAASSSLFTDDQYPTRKRPKIEQICAGSHFSLALDSVGRVWFFGMISAHQWQLNLYAGDSEAQKLKRKELSRPRLLDFVTEVKSPLGGPFAPMCGDLLFHSPEKNSSKSELSMRSFSKLDADYLEFYCGRRTFATPVRSGATDESGRSPADATNSAGSTGSTSTIQRLRRSLKLGLGTKNSCGQTDLKPTTIQSASGSSSSSLSTKNVSGQMMTDPVVFEIDNDDGCPTVHGLVTPPRKTVPFTRAPDSSAGAGNATSTAAALGTRSTATKSNSFGKKQVREWTKRTFAFASRSLSNGSNKNASHSVSPVMNDDNLFGLDGLDNDDTTPPVSSCCKNGWSKPAMTSSDCFLPRFGRVRHKIVSMDCGEHHAAFVSVYGSVFTIGRNDYGQLGVGSGAIFADKPQHVYVLSNEMVEKVRCGRDHCAALTEFSANTIHCWGSNQCGQCMTDGPRKIFYPKPITPDIQPLLAEGEVLDVYCGNKYTFVAHT